MTMRITKDQKIAGIAAIGVRNVLQKVYDDSSFNEQWLAEEIYWLRTKGQFKYTTRRDCLHWLHSKTRRPTPTILPADATGTRAFALLLNSSRLSSSRASFG
jgi:hypothetical protein